LTKNAWKCWVCDTSGKKVFSLIRRFGDQKDITEWLKLDKTIKIDDFDQRILEMFAKKVKKQFLWSFRPIICFWEGRICPIRMHQSSI